MDTALVKRAIEQRFSDDKFDLSVAERRYLENSLYHFLLFGVQRARREESGSLDTPWMILLLDQFCAAAVGVYNASKVQEEAN